LNYEGNVIDDIFYSIMKESIRTSPLPTTTLHCEKKHMRNAKKTTFHDKGKLTCPSFPYSTSITPLSIITLHYEGNVMHDNFPSIMKEGTRIGPLPTTTHYEGKHKCIAKKRHCTMNES
jgi:hypothetical protein